MSKTRNMFSSEVRPCAVWMVVDHEAEHASRWVAVSSIAGKIGCQAWAWSWRPTTSAVSWRNARSANARGFLTEEECHRLGRALSGAETYRGVSVHAELLSKVGYAGFRRRVWLAFLRP